MKKIIALILALVMLGSVSVFAADVTTDADSSLTVGNETGKFLVTEDASGNAVDAAQHTDIWLQVEASGQIDVTVPLLLVFKTNIDGGNATPPTNYGITNNSTADLAMISIVTDPISDTATATSPAVTLKAFSATGEYGEDEYGVQLSVASETDPFDLYNGGTYTWTGSALEPLFVLPQDGETTDVTVNMGTGELSFVTEHDKDGLVENTGVKLMSITYTVAIKTQGGKGETIYGDTTGTDYDASPTTQTYSYGTPPTTP